jgi:hypothetical protein
MSAPRLASLVLALAVAVAPTATSAAELLVLERAGCPYCVRFEKEVGRIYDRTDEGRRAPLRRIDIEKPFPAEYRFVTPDRITPTFVLVDDGHEVARLRGYPGEDFFYGALGTMLEKLPAK